MYFPPRGHRSFLWENRKRAQDRREGKTFRGLELGRWFGRGEGTELRDKSQTATSTITWRLRMAGALRRRTYVPMYVCMYNGRLHAFRPLADVCRWGMQSCVLSFFPLSPLLSAPPIAATGEAADERLSFLRHRLGGRAGGRAGMGVCEHCVAAWCVRNPLSDITVPQLQASREGNGRTGEPDTLRYVPLYLCRCTAQRTLGPPPGSNQSAAIYTRRASQIYTSIVSIRYGRSKHHSS